MSPEPVTSSQSTFHRYQQTATDTAPKQMRKSGRKGGEKGVGRDHTPSLSYIQTLAKKGQKRQ